MALFLLEKPVWADLVPNFTVVQFNNETAPWQAPCALASGPSPLRYVFVFAFLFSIPFIVNYAIIWMMFRHTHLTEKVGKIPPTLPHLVPLLGSTISFVWDGANFIKYATTFMGRQTPVGIALLTDIIYFFQGAENISAIFKQPSLMTAVYIHTTVLKQLFGMSARSIKMYMADNSGSHPKPHSASDVKQHNRIEFLTHENLLKGLSGPGLTPTFDRFTNLLTRELDALDVENEWLQMPDLMEFFKEHLTPPLLEALYGPALLSANPTFVRDIWAYDAGVQYLARRLPRFWVPAAYRLRDKVLASIKRWHALARSNFDASTIYADGDGDPYWGSELVRSRQRLLLGVENLDFDTVASADMGLIWASFTTLVPLSMMVILEVFQDPTLLSRLRNSLRGTVEQTPELDFDMNLVEKEPLLLSVYSETLRRLVAVHITRCAPDHDIKVNNWLLPRNKVMIINTHIAHMDASVWNTKDDAHPLDTFWAERFLIYPNDPASGPVRKDLHDLPAAPFSGKGDDKTEKPRFSLDGLQGSFIPFGGGSRACPGRHLARRQTLLLCAMMIARFDIQILADKKALHLDSSGYGLAIMRPVGKVPFRIRRRK